MKTNLKKNSPDLNVVDYSVLIHCNSRCIVTKFHTLISWNTC